MRHWIFAFSTLLIFPSPEAAAASPAHCGPTVELDALQLLRQASLDLRGRVPSYEEYELVRGSENTRLMAEALIDEMLESPEYFAQVRQYHRGLLWGSLDETVLPALTHGQKRVRASGAGLWFATGRRRHHRGDNIICLNQPQTEFDAEGRPIPIETYDDPVCTGGTCQREGFVMVEPYWAPGTEVKVCAFDAQEADVGTNGVSCASSTGNPACGCGPGMIWCVPDRGEIDELLRQSLAEEPARIFEWVVHERRPYLDAFTTPITLMNGPIAHYYAHNTGGFAVHQNGGITYDIQIPDVPSLPYEAVDAWEPVERGPSHAGALTTMGFLVRFASNRERASHFYSTFYCDPFVPSDDGLPPEEAHPDPNLRERAGCADCHAVLDAAAAHWGRWRTSGTHGFLDVDFDVPRDECLCGEGEDRSCNAFCNAYFVTGDNSSGEELQRFSGLPQAAAWLEPVDHLAVEDGPRALATTEAARERIARCTVRHLGEHLLGRELGSADLEWLHEHTQAFVDGGFDFTALFRRLVLDERYRSIRP